MTQNHDSITLMTQPATVSVISSLFDHGLIPFGAKNSALTLLRPERQWGQWATLLLFSFGWLFITFGLLNALMHHWDNLTTYRHISIITSLLACFGMGLWTYWLPLGKAANDCKKFIIGTERKKIYSIQSILDWLEMHQMLPKAREAQAFLLIAENLGTISPYLKAFIEVLVGLLAASFLLYLPWFTSLHQYQPAICYLIGSCAIVLAFAIFYGLKTTRPWLSFLSIIFVSILMFFGKITLSVAIYISVQHYSPHSAYFVTATSLCVITLLTYPFFPLGIDRFLSVAGALLSLLFCVLLTFNLAVFAGCVLSVFIVGIILYSLKMRTVHSDPLIYACLTLPIALCLSALLTQTHFVTITPMQLLILSVVGTLGGTTLILLGYEKQSPTLNQLGWFFSLICLFRFYQLLPMTQLHKAAFLVLTGSVLLISKKIIEHKK